MKYNCNDLVSKNGINNDIDGIISYKDKIDGSNFLDIDDVEVYGTYSYDKYHESFAFYLTVITKVTVPSAISLKPVEVIVDFDTDLFYNFKVVDDDSFLIKGNEIILDDEIWGEILLNIPPRVVLEGEEFDEDSNEEFDNNPNNPFSSL